MANPSSPQAAEMAHESMVRNLAAQAEAIWPFEAPLFRRYGHPRRILDAGCGTGEMTARLAELFPEAELVGIDLDESHLERARTRCARFGARVRFERDDAMSLSQPAEHFDLAVSRHVLQALPDAGHALRELFRVLRPGGFLHLIAEDYGMLWCHPTPSGSDGFWQVVPQQYGAAVGCDLHVGRKTFTLLTDLGARDIATDHLSIDTVRVPRETFARIWEAWRDGYSDSIGEHTSMPRAEVARRFQEMIDCARDPRGYALWLVPVWSARTPERAR